MAARKEETTLIAITREVSASIGQCELTHVERSPIDVALAIAQHGAYEAALTAMGCRVVALPSAPAFADAVFVEDMAVVTDEVAIMTRAGAASRRGESPGVAHALCGFRPVLRIEAPGTLDGGDVLRIDRDVFVGRSQRTNEDGITQLRGLLSPFGYRVIAVAIRDCLHLKSAVTQAADATLLIQPAWVDAGAFARYQCIEVAAPESHAANVLRIGSTVLMPDCFPHTRALIEAVGISVVAVDVSELQKAEGAVTCCSILLEGDVQY